MADIHELARMMRELDEQLIHCMRCGMCQSVCPVFEQTGVEADVARGKLAILDGLAHEILDDAESIQKRLNKCLLCGTCAANCPSGVSVMDIFLKARSVIGGFQGLPAAKKAIFRGLLANPKRFSRVAKMGAIFQGMFTRTADSMLESSCARFDFMKLEDRHFKNLAKKPLSTEIPSLDIPAKEGKPKVAFFIGCAIDKIFPNIGLSTLKVLKHHGVGIYMPEAQACCGIPVLSSGDSKTFQDLVSHNLRLFTRENFDYLITACATCTSTIKEFWKVMFRGDSGEARKISELAEKSMDINAFLTDVLGVKAAKANNGAKTVTYHDPCHLRNGLGITQQPRVIAQCNPNYAFTEMNDAASCCGCGGSFTLDHYDISTKIGQRKAQNVKESGADIVATGCPACMLQLIDMLSHAGGGVKVKHSIELYAEAIHSVV